jgi:DNA mismatch endonuclease (patch repair protein)
MSSISGKHTKPEIVIADLLVRLRYRFRQNDKNLPGTPDIVFPRRKKVIFVNGCFWHGHINCTRTKLPTTNRIFWKKKISDNIKRDKKVRLKLNKQGWKTLTVWQCQIGASKQLKLKKRIERFVLCPNI